MSIPLMILALILLAALFIYVHRRAQLTRIAPCDFPNVPARTFLDWRRRFLFSTDIVLVATVLTFVPALIVLAFFTHNTPPTVLLVILALALVSWLAALAYSAVIGTRAAREARQLGINWRKRVY